ncbi:unnamed protein product [Rotaria magnacalcarata]|uniref:NAD(P)(+)--arginine ADP-ribosyltransferase n=1 Tax=Rotaria magnacalcarata TaxID=392030 RepID=A0A8S2Q9P9_9BILA|nr:unnamed protein product [Rotaria magnacalcarata]
MAAGSSPNTSVSGRFLDADKERLILSLPLDGYAKKPLVTLEEAVIPLAKIIDNVESRVWVSMERSKSPADNLEQNESAAIRLYTIEWSEENQSLYNVLNETLRLEDRKKLIPWFSYLKLILTALFKLAWFRGTVWRGVKTDLYNLYEVGSHITWWAFSSCSQSREIAETQFLDSSRASTLFQIECLNGKSIQRHSLYKDENEILLLPCSYFEVVKKVKIIKNGLCIIYLRELIPPFKLLEPPFPINENSSEPMTATNNKNTPILAVHFMFIFIDTQMLKMLDLAGNQLGAIGAQHVADNLMNKMQTLTTLNLADNQIGDTGAQCLSNAFLRNQTMIVLILKNNGIGDQGAKSLAEVLQNNKTLTSLDLSANRIGDRGAKHLTDAIEKNNVTFSID